MQSVLDPIPSSSNFESQRTTDLQMKFKYRRVFCFFYYLFIKCIQPKVMTVNYFKICFYFTNKSTLYNPTMYRQYCPVFTPC